jgi:hypothetical protein
MNGIPDEFTINREKSWSKPCVKSQICERPPCYWYFSQVNSPLIDKLHALAFSQPSSQGVIGFFSEGTIAVLESLFQATFWDIGKSVSGLIQGLLDTRYLYLEVQEHLAEIPESCQTVIPSTGNSIVLLSNLAILLEPDLAFDLNHWLERLTSNHLVIVELSAFEMLGTQALALRGPGPTSTFSVENIPILALEQCT